MSDARPVAAIFRTALFNPSERFVRDQGEALTRWRPLFVGLERKGEPVPAILPESALERALFALRGRGGSIERRLRAAAPKLIHAHFATDALRVLPLARALGLPLVARGKRLQVASLRGAQTKTIRYTITFQMRGYYQLGPAVLETGDVFGLHRRHRVVGEPVYVMVYPKVLPLPKYDFASERPIGEIRLQNRLFEDPTRTAGVREYVVGDPLQRVHWKVTARTGTLHCRVYEPTSLAGATILVDFHTDGYSSRGEPHRSDLAITTAASIAYAVSALNQQLGLASNGRDAADRIREEALEKQERQGADGLGYETREEARGRYELLEENERIRPVVVDTRRGFDQFQKVREALARLELSDAMTFGQMALDLSPRMPRDATVIAVLPRVSVESAVALGALRRMGFAVTAVLIGLDDADRLVAHGRLLAETVRDIRYINTEAELSALGSNTAVEAPAAYGVDIPLDADG